MFHGFSNNEASPNRGRKMSNLAISTRRLYRPIASVVQGDSNRLWPKITRTGTIGSNRCSSNLLLHPCRGSGARGEGKISEPALIAVAQIATPH